MSDIVINLLVTGFVLAMGYVWYIYGLFSALLHLVVTICAGALALAVWEPLVYGVLLGINTHFAWAAGLLLPFGVLLAAGRFAINKAVPEDLDLPTLVSSLGGAACGLASGVLTAGLTLMGASLLPLPTNVLGYEPYIVEADGEVALQADGDGQLWFAVDEMAADFFSWASAGGLGSSTPLHRYRPSWRGASRPPGSPGRTTRIRTSTATPTASTSASCTASMRRCSRRSPSSTPRFVAACSTPRRPAISCWPRPSGRASPAALTTATPRSACPPCRCG